MTKPQIKNGKMPSIALPHDPDPNVTYARLKHFKQNKNTHNTLGCIKRLLDHTQCVQVLCQG